MTGRPRRIALATCAALPDGDADDRPLIDALRRLDAAPQWAVWDDPAVEWAAYDLVLIRSTWDYTQDHARFLDWAGSIDRLVNPAAVVAWSSDKRYLLDLAGAGVPIVPTTLAAPGEPALLPERGRFVIKPSVGAGTRGAGRFDAGGADAALAHLRLLHDAGRTALIQPYIEEVDSRGETGLVFLDGRFSHAIRKSSMLPPGAAHTLSARDAGGLFHPERIGPRRASGAEIAAARRVLDAAGAILGGQTPVAAPNAPAAAPAAASLSYARVDLLPGPDGPLLIELELIEPSLFLRYGPPDAALRFAQGLVERARAAAADA